jgi:hypothetical protein
MIPLMGLACAYLFFTGPTLIQVDHTSPTPPNVTGTMQAMESNQNIPCNFTAQVVSLTPITQPLPQDSRLPGYLIDKEPAWEVALDVKPHQNKIPFQPGLRKCNIADVQKVFGCSAEKVEGEYEFSFTWNIGVPGKPEFESFTARKR